MRLSLASYLIMKRQYAAAIEQAEINIRKSAHFGRVVLAAAYGQKKGPRTPLASYPLFAARTRRSIRRLLEASATASARPAFRPTRRRRPPPRSANPLMLQNQFPVLIRFEDVFSEALPEPLQSHGLAEDIQLPVADQPVLWVGLVDLPRVRAMAQKFANCSA
jgi:hypothetical protein